MFKITQSAVIARKQKNEIAEITEVLDSKSSWKNPKGEKKSGPTPAPPSLCWDCPATKYHKCHFLRDETTELQRQGRKCDVHKLTKLESYSTMMYFVLEFYTLLDSGCLWNEGDSRVHESHTDVGHEDWRDEG